MLEEIFRWRKNVNKEETLGDLWKKAWNPTLALKYQKLQKELKEVQKERDVLYKDKIRLVNRLSLIKELFIDIEKVFFSSKFTRRQIAKMSQQQYAELEAEIDKEVEEGRVFLNE